MFERLDLARIITRRWIGDDNIGHLMLNRGLQFGPTRHGYECVLRAEDHSEVREELSGEERDDVHVVVESALMT